MFKLKAVKIGNSVGFIIPREIRDQLNIKAGENYEVSYNKDKKVLYIYFGDKQSKNYKYSSGSLEFKKWLKEAMVEDSKILDLLAGEVQKRSRKK